MDCKRGASNTNNWKLVFWKYSGLFQLITGSAMLIILAILIRLIGRMKHSEDADTRFEILGL
jgi:hypothetical protein